MIWTDLLIYIPDGKSVAVFVYFQGGLIVSDNDMENRYEQTMLMLSTMKSFGYKGYDHIVIHGTHCSYCAECDADGNSVLTKMIFDFVDNE